MTKRLSLRDVWVGYAKDEPVVRNVDLVFVAGKMTCVLGPNGSGKTTLLRTMARLLPPLRGQLLLPGRHLGRIRALDLARLMGVVLTKRLALGHMTGRDVASLGRYPYTGFFGRLGREDELVVAEALRLCRASHLADRPFDQLSDGQKQKVLIARALAQQPQILILDEPTMHLDLRHKLEILSLLKGLTLETGLTVVLTLHEPDLAIKSCDRLVLVKDARISAHGPVAQVVATEAFADLYGLAGTGFDPLTGGVEFPAPDRADVFIAAGGGSATLLYRACARMGIGFGTGVLHEGDLDYYTARNMGAPLVSLPAFRTIGEEDVARAWAQARKYRWLLDSGFPLGEANQALLGLVALARRHGQGVLSLRAAPPPGARRLSGADELAAALDDGGGEVRQSCCT